MLQALRAQIGMMEGNREKEHFPFSLLQTGVPRGALMELCGPGKTEVTVQFLAENPSLRVAWVEENLSVNPCAFMQRGVDLNRIFFVDAGVEAEWSALQVLRSQLFEVVVLHITTTTAQDSQERVLRRFQLAAEKAGVGVILLAEKPRQAWPISLQLLVSRTQWDRTPEVEILRRRC